MKFVRKMYDWVLSWAETPYGTTALAVLAFAEASFFPIPPDVLLVALSVGKRRRALWFAFVCSVASLFGGLAGYAIGWGLWGAVDQFFFAYIPGFTVDVFDKVKDLYAENGFVIVFTAAFTPIPYKVITIAAGVCKINLPLFLLASVVGRSMRFFLVAGLIYIFGEKIRDFIDKWFNLLSILFVILLVAGFAALKLLGH
jgi:membrane protein YqaA with SNARE-associated domain